MAYIKTLETYSAFLYPYEGEQIGRINLYCGDHKLYLKFLPSSDALPSNTFDATNKIGMAYQPFSRFQYYLDLVRNEKPIKVTFRPKDKPPTYVVYCSYEPPGEGEI